ncbi:Protein F59F5.7 [Aphelenchoides avenae]|nr:Protein F59F5.7 [Aphelenchus avenae]
MQYQKSMFRSKQTKLAVPVASVERYGSSERALARPFSHADNSAPTDFGSLYKTTDVRALPSSAQYSRLSPAPYGALSAHESGNNIVDSIFSQSQIRHAPVSAPITPTVGYQGASPLSAFSTAGANPLELLANGAAPLEQITRLAKSLLSIPGGGNQELFGLMAKALSAGATDTSKLTSTALTSSATKAAAAVVSGAKTAEVAASAAEKATEVAAGGAESLISSSSVDDGDASNDTSTGQTDQQKDLLEAAIRNGEIDTSKLPPTLSTLLENNSKSSNSLIRSGSKLMEWIQQNRPRTADEEDVSVVSAAKLPYYGRYCGSFVEQTGFEDGYQNVTFWAGPAKITGLAADVFPSANGFYLKPETVDIRVFMAQQPETIPAKIRKVHFDDTDAGNFTAEAEEVEEEADVKSDNLTANEVRRMRRKRAVEGGHAVTVPLHLSSSSGGDALHLSIGSDVKTPSPAVLEGLQHSNETQSIDDNGTVEKEERISSDRDGWQEMTQMSTVTEATRPDTAETVDVPHVNATSEQAELKETTTTTTTTTVVVSNKSSVVERIAPLEWHEGFQPLLLTMPEGRSVKDIHWVSLYDHRRRVVDTKTIEIVDFHLQSKGVPLWFMAGRELIPNANGHILTVFNRITSAFDCDSLRDYNNETVTVRLPGGMDVKDVFWFSVFSPTQGLPWATVYLPYNEIQPPPDLLGMTTPLCNRTSTVE